MSVDPFDELQALIAEDDVEPKRYCPRCDQAVLRDTLHCHGECNTCLPLASFRKHGGNRTRGGLDYLCKQCRRGYDKVWRNRPTRK